MGTAVILAVEGDSTLSTVFSSLTAGLVDQFNAALPTVATTAGAIIATVIGIGVVYRLFRKLVG
jgi:hypothetical protein